MSRAAPSVQDIVDLAEQINAIALAGRVASVAEQVMDLIYSAVPGAPGKGLHIFQNALHADVIATSDSTNAWRFRRLQQNDQRHSGARKRV